MNNDYKFKMNNEKRKRVLEIVLAMMDKEKSVAIEDYADHVASMVERAKVVLKVLNEQEFESGDGL